MTLKISHFSKSIVVVGLLPPMDSSSDVIRDSREIQKHLSDMLCSPQANIWCIYDFSDVEIEFGHLLMMFIDQNREKLGSFSDPRLQVVGVVCNEAMATNLAGCLTRFNVEMPLFERFDDAVAHVYQQIDVESMLSTLNLI